ncbi:NADAR family protein [Pedobacter caeni]|uniref:NADAR domain-containing protein n=1 Tax=Pedobacter caeni TaxID=288992 RepID=A0A1M4ZDT9_9SPHI|nr:NADAR family protein [Pedobacter caeni]SHF16171.1 hypothetical protein SAMN04488522_102289 [Pedobacter caeni]
MTNSHKEELIKKYQKKEKIKFLFFWGHQPAKDGHISASCFSQWWIAPFTHEGKTYPSTEHWMMAKKAELFEDFAIAKRILEVKSPAEVKKLGRLVERFDAKVWDAHKFDIVLAGNYHKFNQHQELKDFLLQTKNRVIVEASPVDPVWGIGLAADDPKAENPLLWKGENLLGFVLMEVRSQLNA